MAHTDTRLTDPHAILILEDDGSLASELCQSFAEVGYVVTCVSTPEDALAELVAGCQLPVLVVVDLFLPTADVYAIGRRLRANGATTLLLVLNSIATPEFELPTAPRVHTIGRPVTAYTLLTTGQRIIDGSRRDPGSDVKPLSA